LLQWTKTADVAETTILLRLMELATLSRSGLLPTDLHPGVDPFPLVDAQRAMAGTGST
jgi:hypothetical protein